MNGLKERGCQMNGFDEYKLYDLTRVLSPDSPTIFMDLSYYRPPITAITTDFKGTHIVPNRTGFFETVHIIYSHSGTHMDAPGHYFDDSEHWDIHEVPLERLMGEGVILGIPKGERGEIILDDLDKAEPKIQEGDIVIFNTGWHQKYCGPISDWEKAKYYASNWPGLDEEVAQYLVSKKIKWVGIDNLCLDPYSHSEYGNNTWIDHVILLKENIPIVEEVVGQIDEITGKRCLLMALPIPIYKSDASQCRVVALVKKG
jgi:kynurenine formamidase